MDDVTDVVFRSVVASVARPDVFFTEFTAADGLFSPGKTKVIQKLRIDPEHSPCVAQIWGTDPRNIFRAAKLIQEIGFDGIDINMGCPVRAVMSKGAGSAMILNYDLTRRVIDAARQGAPDIPLSIKTRLGIKKLETDEWIPFLLEQKINALTIHGRTAKQLSKGDANWDEIGKAVQIRNKISPDTVLIGNGDIASYPQALEMHQKHGVNGIMIGRGIFSDPWIFDKESAGKERSKEEYINLLIKHMDLFETTWEGEKNFEIMRKFFKMYVNNFRGASDLRVQLMATKSPKEVKELLL